MCVRLKSPENAAATVGTVDVNVGASAYRAMHDGLPVQLERSVDRFPHLT